MESYIIISFESVNFAMQTEAVLKREEIHCQIMPTPREITLSCGISIKISVDNLDNIKKLVDENKIRIKGLYICEFKDKQKNIEKIG